MRRYTAFEEVNKDLKILKLQKDINTEELKLYFNKTKESLSPRNFLTSMLGSVTSGEILIRLLTPVASFAIHTYLRRKK